MRYLIVACYKYLPSVGQPSSSKRNLCGWQVWSLSRAKIRAVGEPHSSMAFPGKMLRSQLCWLLMALMCCLTLYGVSAASFGTCVELCPSGGCPSGQRCVSNGCGHYCA
ncbi:uncharacterized protein LOC134527591 [Bacillus rossius redtenbacheri]|uniref:uncharacterized protein LOC134527591 n=1 Tax=Bacillus rossius redtenbacheri TaxID=93214 RepID=UPI002FDC8C9F